MCCSSCYAQSCCCNCASIKTGVIIWALIDMIYNMAAFVGLAHLTRFEIEMDIPNLFYWTLVVIFADLGLSIGAYTSNLCMIVFWLVITMINIVSLCLIFLLLVTGVNSKYIYITLTTLI